MAPFADFYVSSCRNVIKVTGHAIRGGNCDVAIYVSPNFKKN